MIHSITIKINIILFVNYFRIVRIMLELFNDFIISKMCKLVISMMKILLLLLLFSCNSKQNIKSYIHDIEPVSISGNSNAVIEIPAGTHDKFEVSKTNGQIVQDIEQGLPRKIKYLGYPGNYGMIPKTLLPIEDGGDGDPLDVLVLGEPLEKGSIVDVRLVGVLSMLDEGEIDDKLIAVRVKNSLFSKINSFTDLENEYHGITDILKIWFSNYKGSGEVLINGFGDEKLASEIFFKARKYYLDN